MPNDRRTATAHHRLAALAAGGDAAADAGASCGWVPAAPVPGEGGGAPASADRGRVVLPFARARAAAPVTVPSEEPDDLDPWDDHGQVRPRSRGRHRAAVPQDPLVPATVRGARWRVSRRAAAGMLLALAVLAGVIALRAGSPGQGATVVPARSGQETSAPSAAGSMPEPAGAADPVTATVPGTVLGSGAPGPELVVHVVGQVLEPGLVRLATGSRVADAVEAAGGATPEADLSRVNLARAVVDGEQVVLPLPGEPVGAAPAQAGGEAPGGGSSGTGGAGAAPVDLNAADLAALDGLPGIGPVLAQRILDWRTENGRFVSVEELGEVTGIGDKLLSQLRDAVTV